MPEVVHKWTSRSATNDLEWIIVVDGNQPEAIEVAKKLASENGSVAGYVQDSPPFNCVRGWNLAAEKATGTILIAVADDFEPPTDWDKNLLALQPDAWKLGEHVVHVNDGFVRTLCTLAIVTRTRYERFGYLFYPGYESLFSDTELTEVAYRDGVVINAMHLLFEHMHPDCNKRPRDNADALHASRDRWRRGEMLFNYRKFKGFPVDAGPKAVSEQAATNSGPRRYVAYMQVNRDDFCLLEVCQRLLEEGVKDFFFAVPVEYWTGAKTRQEDFDSVYKIADQVSGLGGTVRVKQFKVSNYRFAGDSRITVETRLRNDSLSWIRKEGFNDILIVDGDELWKPGALKHIDQLVQAGVGAVNAALIPVIGLPGYPVDRAQDTAVVYIGSNINFSVCRTPTVLPTKIHEPLLYHFTGTRRTMSEIIDKHKASGHYDDPDYAFDEWLREVLPHIAPGFTHTWKGGNKGVHMYLPYQIWPTVRFFTSEEVKEIPESLYTFLGISAEKASS